MYYENFEKLLTIKGVKPSDVAKATGISTATLSNWKKGGYTPKQGKLQLIADYFDVKVDCLLNGNEEIEVFSDENGKLAALIRKDLALSAALQKYATMSDSKKKLVIEYINMLSEVSV
jgi:transcriptional regulator with XRE-family HTH domain